MAIRFHANTFVRGTLTLGNGDWRQNRFDQCRLLVDALPVEFLDNELNECQLEFPPNGVTPLDFAAWLDRRDPALAAALRRWVAQGGWKPPSVH